MYRSLNKNLKNLTVGLMLNPGSVKFEKASSSSTYVDKTDMIDLLNKRINTEQFCLCVSRPRRFGKTLTASMIAAYYDKSVDSREIFSKRKLASCDNWDKELNKYRVIYIDIAYAMAGADTPSEALHDIQRGLLQDLQNTFFELDLKDLSIPNALAKINKCTREQFVVIIDEWDAFYRDAKFDLDTQKKYIDFLRSLFKSAYSSTFIALAYLTGILPIKKYNSESALNNFTEFDMISPKKLAPFMGFTEQEVSSLCTAYGLDFDELSQWYDGYSFDKIQHIYSPNSVIQAVINDKIENYWSKTVAFSSLSAYINMNFEGLHDAIVSMLGGNRIVVDVSGFQNDMINFKSRDDVLTILIHLGYLGYDSATQEVYIPNFEVRQIFERCIKDNAWDSVITAMETSKALLEATISCDEKTVASLIEKCHEENISLIKYNDENSLSCVINLAYYYARNEYNLLREFPSGKGFADIVFLPKSNFDTYPIIVELKWDKTALSAIKQIKERKYVAALADYNGPVLLVGINYDKASKIHECIIEKIYSSSEGAMALF